MALAGDLSVHCIRRQIDLAGPRDSAAINEDLLEKLHIPQLREYTCQLFSPQPHTASQPVFESHKEAIVRLRLHFSYVPYIEQYSTHANGSIFAGDVFSRQSR